MMPFAETPLRFIWKLYTNTLPDEFENNIRPKLKRLDFRRVKILSFDNLAADLSADRKRLPHLLIESE